MDKVFCKQSFMKLQLLVITGITVFMFIPPTFGCEITEVTLYAGADAPDAEEADCETFYIGKNGDVVFHAICEGVTNPDELEIKWKFNFDNGGTTVDYSDETSYDSDGDYLKKTSSTANYDTAGTKSPSVTCYLIDSDGNQVGNSVSDTCTVHVVSVNIEMQSLGEEDASPPHEEDPGALVAKNHNDSDGNGDEDLTDTVIPGGDPDLIEATLSITPSGVDVGKIVLTPSSGTTLKVYENQDKSGGQEYSWDLSSTSNPGTVYVEGFRTGTANLKIVFEYDNDDDGDDDELCDDTVKVTVADVDVLVVPQYLFASATYAIPIKFEVNGPDSDVWINGLTSHLYLDDLAGCSGSIGQRFVADDGTTRSNGTSSTYTGYVATSAYAGVDLAGVDQHATNDAHFVIEASISLVEGGPIITLESLPGDAEAQLDSFADASLFAIEPAISGVESFHEYTPAISSGMQATVDSTGCGEIRHLEAIVNSSSSCDGIAFSHIFTDVADVCELWADPSDLRINLGGFDGFSAGQTGGSNEFGASTVLDDDWDLIGMGGQEGICKFYGYRRGGYLYASYGGKELHEDDPADPDDEPSILASGEYAMDLDIEHMNIDWTLFETGSYKLKNNQGTSLGHGAGTAILGFAIDWALTSSPWKGFWPLADEAFDIIDSVATELANDRAESVVYRVFVYTLPGATPQVDVAVVTRDQTGENSWTPHNSHYDRVVQAGDQCVLFVEVESTSSATAKYPSTVPTSINVSSVSRVKAGTSGDFNNMLITVGTGF